MSNNINTLTPGDKVYIKHEDDYFGYILLMYNENYALLSPTIDKENNLDVLCKKWAKHSLTGHNCTIIVPREKLLTEAEVKEKEGVA